MMTPFTFDFGYSPLISWGHLIPLGLSGGIVALGLWLGWRKWLLLPFVLLAAWGAASLLITHYVFRLNLPVPPPSDRFLSSGSGRVVDVGAGSGRATVGLLLAKPGVTVTAVDIYSGYFGIDDNTPERLTRNARIASVAERADATVGDARDLPLPDGAYDGVISLAAIDHLPRGDIGTALAEAWRVLKPGGEFLLTIVNVDAWAWLTSPHALAHHPRADPARWRALLEAAGFEIVEEGTSPAARYFLGVKRPRPDAS